MDSEPKEFLLIQMRFGDNALAKQAIERIKAKGWHKDGTLRGQNFAGAKVEGVKLIEFDLQKANFYGANFQH